MPREIVTKAARFYCVSLKPDICKTPAGPGMREVPYNVKGEFAEATGVSAGITSANESVVVHTSTVIPTVTGDEEGTGKGVKSGTVAKRVQLDERSSTVSFNGERAVRVGDQVFMNDKNTVGKVYERLAGGEGANSASAVENAPHAREVQAAGVPLQVRKMPKPEARPDREMHSVFGGTGPAGAVGKVASAARILSQVRTLAQTGGLKALAKNFLQQQSVSRLQEYGVPSGALQMLTARTNAGQNGALQNGRLTSAPISTPSAFISQALLNRLPGSAAFGAQLSTARTVPCGCTSRSPPPGRRIPAPA